MSMSAEVEDNNFRLATFLASNSFVHSDSDGMTASGAGKMPSVRANSMPALKVGIWKTALLRLSQMIKLAY